MPVSKLRRLLHFSLAGLALIAVVSVSVYALALERLTRRHEVEPDALTVPSGEEALGRGRHLVEVVAACTSCHGPDLAGREMADDPWLGRLWASNLTPGVGGVAEWSDADLIRAVRHGVKPDATPVLMMPAQYFYHLSDADLGSVIAYLRSLPPVDREPPGFRLGIASAFIIVSGAVPELVPADLLAEAPPRLEPPTPAASLDYGAYLVETSGCKVCHHEDLSGGLHPLALPEEPPPSDLTPGGRVALWSEGEFVETLRTGVTPEGDQLDEEWMPWPAIGRMSDLELRAIYRYLRSIPAPEGGSVQDRA